MLRFDFRGRWRRQYGRGQRGSGVRRNRSGLAAQQLEHLIGKLLLLAQNFFQHRTLRVCNSVCWGWRGWRRSRLLSERLRWQPGVHVGCDGIERAQFLHQLAETDRDAELSFKQLRSLCEQKRIQTQFHEVRVSVNFREVVSGKPPQQRTSGGKQTILSSDLRLCLGW